MFQLTIITVPHEGQSYETIGDWWFEDEDSEQPTLHITVSEMGNWRYEALVGMHEAIEALLCRDRAISQKSVTEFDKAFLIIQKEGAMAEGVTGIDEPGDSPRAPYHFEHGFATAVERMLAAALEVPWGIYAQAVDNVGKEAQAQ